MMKRWLMAAALAVLLVAPPALILANSLTPLLNLNQPNPGVDTNWGPLLNANMTTLDGSLITAGSGIAGRIAVFSDAAHAGPSTMAIGALATLTGTQTLIGKTIDSATNTLKVAGITITALSGNAGKLMSAGAGTFPSGNLPKFDAFGNLVDSGLSSAGGAAPFPDNVALVKNVTDPTKTATFDLSLLPTGVLRKYKLPDVANDVVVLLDATQTLTHKTIDTAATGQVFKVNGLQITDYRGSVGKVQLSTGSFVNNNLIKFDANGNAVDSGVPTTAIITSEALLETAIGLDVYTTTANDFTSAQLATSLTDETGTGGGFVRATGPTIDSPIITTKMNPPQVTAFPGSPSNGDVVIVTDDSAAGACDSAAGSAKSWCIYDGAAWIALGGGGGALTIPGSSSGTIPNTANSKGLDLEVITTTGTATSLNGLRLLFDGAGTGAYSVGMAAENDNLNTGTGLGLSSGYPSGTIGVQGAAFSAAAGNSVGVDGEASSSNAYNVGVFGFGQGGLEPGSTTGTAIGVLGAATGSDESTDFKNVAGYFSIYTSPVTGKNISAAVVAIGSAADPIAVFYDGSAEKVRIDAGGSLQLKAQDEIRFYDADSSNYVGFKSPTTVAADKIWKLPIADSTGTQCLSSDGALNLGWSSCSGGGGITGSLTAGRVPVASGAGTVVDTANYTFDTTNFRERIQNATTSSDGTLNMLQLSGTLPASPSAAVTGAFFSITSAGSASQQQRNSVFSLASGYSGSSATTTGDFYNSAVGLGNTLNLNSFSAPIGNFAVRTSVTGASTGLNAAVAGDAVASTGINIGAYFKSNGAAAGSNIGVLGNASGSGETTDLQNVAGLFTLHTALPTANISVAILADGAGNDIFRGYNAAALKFRILPGGGIVSEDLKTTGSAGTKKVVCVDTTTGQLYASSTTTDCSN
jgi:hypothetical protein